jgi:YmgG-like glycine-zipper protein
MRHRTTAIVAGLVACALVSAAQAEVFVYPKPGQSQQEFESDQYSCHNWATQQTGFNPAAPPPAAGAPPPQQGGAVSGAAVGAVGGAIAGDAGKGAAVGAAVGGTGGAMRQNRQNREAAAASQQAQAQQQAGYANYEKAYGACLSGRGYSVK